MTRSQWESLCDGCGRCCLHKLRDEDTDEIAHTNVSCRLLNTETCFCSDYEKRHRKVPDCVTLTPAVLSDIDWLPPSCAYRLVKEGYDLPSWHPLRAGNREQLHNQGVSVANRCVNERRAGMLEDHIVEWPGEWPTKAERPSRL
ncbi:YcgN family cysteine cluster protein [Neokomagataea tanensis]|uniref:YcgN family cysteine cluster protein n=1 Tax=Neokomagataea tanensis TaxID=661191 RepID=A0A4Y6V5W5_9PROT|nr:MULTISPECIES: YcgN family cysteine cluster protein [Neokomagataea]QDH25522.1 YcgN family cysteine cluster protein [Neokomagataea tanensis]